MAVSRKHIGCHLSGRELWLNIGWNTQGNQEIPRRIPEELRMFGVRQTDWAEFADELRSVANRNVLPAQLTSWMMCFSLCMPCIWICSCPYILYRKKKFDDGLADVVHRCNERSPWNRAVDFLYCDRAQMNGQGKVWPPLGYNIVFQLPVLRGKGSDGVPRALTFSREEIEKIEKLNGVEVTQGTPAAEIER